ncbi:hypothetical protein [Paracraurococcus ruber]|uniref:ABM domain-containing protein n=1 Tax=Paracraurococcus ruber TaxID=77675 RepID=A0ABS1CVD6_9PROT|nr:hypothetical protein [Paracraurococcus ruber]MBK1658478.1 hypothetical protein [Paracraurococcus ruber]TDG31220.1 hypothetical protein E2C05_11765 [Paracraurococcus ruber]
MYLARFSYDVRPADRQRAMDFIRREVAAAQGAGLKGRLLVPLTRGQGGAALQFEVELKSLDQLETLRQHGGETRPQDWMHAFAQVLTAPPMVELLRIDAPQPGGSAI